MKNNKTKIQITVGIILGIITVTIAYNINGSEKTISFEKVRQRQVEKLSGDVSKLETQIKIQEYLLRSLRKQKIRTDNCLDANSEKGKIVSCNLYFNNK